MEYRYALEKGKPIIAFLHKDPGQLQANRTEKDPQNTVRLQEFRKLAQKKHVKYWTTPHDLGSIVSRGIIRLIKTNPSVGWVKADKVPDENTTREILRLRSKIEELEGKLNEARTKAPQGTEYLAQGDDQISICYTFEIRNKKSYKKYQRSGIFDTSWNELFSRIGPLMIDEAKEKSIYSELNKFVVEKQRKEILFEIENTNNEFIDCNISSSDFQTIKIQFRALGLMVKSVKQRSVKDTSTYWTLTPYGDEVLTKLRAIRNNKPK